MSKALPDQTIDKLSHDLFVYDVEQSGWEHEDKGQVVNYRHVLTHLVKDQATKDFYDEEVVETAIAPDSLQYAFRFSRWAGITATDSFWSEGVKKPKDTRERVELLEFAREQHIRALGVAAMTLHDLDHEATRDDAVNRLDRMAGNAAGFLVSSAYHQAVALDFDLAESFSNRLTTLRQRFDVPEPESV